MKSIFKVKQGENFIQFFTITNKDIDYRDFNQDYIATPKGYARIVGKHFVTSQSTIPEIRPQDNFRISRACTFNYDISYDVDVVINNKKRKLNTEIIYLDSEAKTVQQSREYTYLTYCQRFKEKKKRNQLWIQQVSNIMWIVSVLVAILAIYATINS